MDTGKKKQMINAIEQYCNAQYDPNDIGFCRRCKYKKDPEAFCKKYDYTDCPDTVLEAWYRNITNKEETVVERVDHPSHYQGKHECIDEMRALFGDEAVKAFCRCNIWKYTYRADSKNGEEDLKKAEWYMDYLMNMIRPSNNKSLLG